MITIKRKAKPIGKGKYVKQAILVGDIGGTNIRFAVAKASDTGLPSLTHVWRAPANDFAEFSDALAYFLKQTPIAEHPAQAVFALAGPIDKNSVQLTNNSWTVRRDDLISRFGFERLVFMNDFAAMARSIPELSESAFFSIQKGDPTAIITPKSTLAVAGAGTGLGQALLVGDSDSGWNVLPTEGGHQPFAPIDSYEIEIHKVLRKQHSYVSYELICSGSGLIEVYSAIAKIEGKPVLSLKANEITQHAKMGDELAISTCEFTANALMNFTGNAVLASGSWQGAVLAGGVSKHLQPYLTTPAALERFNNKGKMRSRMERVQLRLLVDSTAPLIGAASIT